MAEKSMNAVMGKQSFCNNLRDQREPLFHFCPADFVDECWKDGKYVTVIQLLEVPPGGFRGESLRIELRKILLLR